MNLKTTFVLLILVVAGGCLFWFGPSLAPKLGLAPPPSAPAGDSLSILEDSLTPDRVYRIVVQQGDRSMTLERAANGDWTLPGRWPTRKAEVDELVGLLTGLRTRFTPLPLEGPDALARYGLERPPVVVTVRAGEQDYRLAFGEEPGESNRFSRPTFLRIDERPEVIRLAPGLLAALSRPQDYYQQRRLFPSERVAREGEPQEKVERLTAQTVRAQGGGTAYTLNRTGADWQLSEPVRDRPDPDRLRALLTAVPDLWAEQFVEAKKGLAEYGLDKPEQTLQVTRPGGDATTLLVGKESQLKVRTVTRPAPAFGGPPMPPQKEVIHEAYRYAKLQDNDQVFEIKADKLKDIFVPTDQLRDARLARFRPEDVQKVEIHQGGQDIVLEKEKGAWRVRKPFAADAEGSKVTELLDKLSGLQARDKDVLDKADPKSYGLEQPSATVQLTVEETSGEGEARTRQPRTLTYQVGKHDVDRAKLYVRVAGWDRINAVEEGVLKLVDRPALAYRGRRVLDLAAGDLAKIKVRRGKESFTLEQEKGTWHLASPVRAELDAAKASQLASELARLEAVEYVTENASPEDLDSRYGLASPALALELTPADKEKPAQELLVGKQREGRPEFYARLAGAPGVFVLKKEVRDTLDQDALAYRPLQLWQVPAEDIAALRIQRGEQDYRLRKDGPTWRIEGPFEAAALPSLVNTMTAELANLRAERYVAHAAQDLAAYGLEKPALRVELQEKEKPAADKKESAPARPRVLLVGKPVEKEPQARYARLGDSEAIFVLAGKVVSAVDHAALDLLDRKLLSLDTRTLDRIHSTGAAGPLTLQRQGDAWRVVESPASPFPADPEAVARVLAVWANLQAQRYVAYGPRADLAAHGLDRPAATVTVSLQPPPIDGKPAKPAEHTVALGKPVDGEAGARYARVDGGPGIVVLAPGVATELTATYLDFVNRTLFALDPAAIVGLQRQQGNDVLELARQGETWQLVKPTTARADGPTLDRLVEQLARLRALRVAAYPLKDAKALGLDAPAAVLTLRLTGAEKGEHTLKIGKVADEASGDRFAQANDSPVAAVLPGALARQLLAPAVQFRDRTLARFADADRILLERGPRKVVFAKIDGTWKMTEPIAAEAEQADLEDFLNALARLRADELVADKPADLKPYGLDKPEATWRLLAGDREVLRLQVGNRDKPAGGRAYARLANSDLVFLLDPKLSERALGEFRTRSVWPALDASQVERITLQEGSRAVELEKSENAWKVVGKPDLAVNAEAVRELLDALAGLRAARYVEDRGAALKLYGLEPPQLVVEVQTRSGKRVLHVGRREGESQRRYARVPEGDAVFTLAEADAARIVRPLADFARP